MVRELVRLDRTRYNSSPDAVPLAGYIPAGNHASLVTDTLLVAGFNISRESSESNQRRPSTVGKAHDELV